MDANKYVVDYNDERLTGIKEEQENKESQTENNYNEMINNSDAFYQQQIQNSKEWAEKQQQIQQENTDFAIEKVNQEKEKAEKDYTKEQKGSYVDYQKTSNNYGVNAEQMALTGLNNSGYSETTKASMFNTYQNRVAVAREGFNQAIQNYNNSIKEAQLANNSTLAEISHKSLQEQLELSLQGFQYKNSLLQAKQEQLNVLGNRYDNKYQNMLNQINNEIETKRETDQFNEEKELKLKQLKQEYDQWVAEMQANQKQREEESKQAWAKINLQEQQLKQSKTQWEKEYELSKAKTYSSTSNQLSVSDNKGNYVAEVENKLDNVYNTINKDLGSIYKDYSDDFKNKAKEQAKKAITSKIQSEYNSGNITYNEAKRLFDKYGY